MSGAKERFNITRKILYFTGTAIMGDDKSILYKVYSYVCRIMVYFNYCTIVADTLLHLDDLSHTIAGVALELPVLSCLWIDVFISFNRRPVEELLYLTEKFSWEDCPERDEKSGRLTMAGIIPKVQKYVVYIVLAVALPHGLHMLHRGMQSRDLLGVDAWYPFETSSSPTYELILAMQIFCSFIYTAKFYGILGLYAMLVFIACAQLKKVRNSLEQIGEDDLKNLKEKGNRKLAKCIGVHQTVLSFMGSMQSALSALLFGHFLIELIGIAFACFGFVMLWGDMMKLYTVILVFIGQMLILAVYCVLGSELSNQAEDVGISAYSCEWIGSPVTEQRTLMFVIAAANTDFKLLAGGFIPVTKETMLAVLNQAFSFTMFLLNFKEVEEDGLKS